MQITEMKAKVNTMEDIKSLVAILNQFPGDVDVSSAQYMESLFSEYSVLTLRSRLLLSSTVRSQRTSTAS